jgi:hypothetical protein
MFACRIRGCSHHEGRQRAKGGAEYPKKCKDFAVQNLISIAFVSNSHEVVQNLNF